MLSAGRLDRVWFGETLESMTQEDMEHLRASDTPIEYREASSARTS